MRKVQTVQEDLWTCQESLFCQGGLSELARKAYLVTNICRKIFAILSKGLTEICQKMVHFEKDSLLEPYHRKMRCKGHSQSVIMKACLVKGLATFSGRLTI